MTHSEITGLTWQKAYSALESGVHRLVDESNARAALVVRGDGQLLTAAGGVHDTSSLGALAAGSMAAGEGLLAGIEDRGRFSIALDGEEQSLFLTMIDQGAFLVVMFDKRCALGLVRLRARRLVEEARPWVAGLLRQQGSVLGELDEDDVDALFAGSFSVSN